MRVYDLSVPIMDGADWYHEEITPPVRVRDIGGTDGEGWVSHIVELAVLNGTTYIETAAHLFKDAPTLDQLPPERFLRPAHVVGCHISGQQIEPPDRVPKGFAKGDDAVLLHCGWDAHLGQADYYAKSPYFSSRMQTWLLNLRPSILGGDMLSLDRPDDGDMPFLRAYFGTGGMILCPLQGLGDIPTDRVTLCAAPMKLPSANCAPCRALAWTG